MRKNRCPLCGGKTVEVTEKSFFTAVDGNKVAVTNFYKECVQCHESTLDDDKSVKALKKAQLNYFKEGTADLIERVTSKYASASFVERSLRLPQRTLNRWKNDGGSTSAFLMLKIIDTFPFIVDVAKNNFSREEADKAILKEASLAFERLNTIHKREWDIRAERSSTVITVKFISSESQVISPAETLGTDGTGQGLIFGNGNNPFLVGVK